MRWELYRAGSESRTSGHAGTAVFKFPYSKLSGKRFPARTRTRQGNESKLLETPLVFKEQLLPVCFTYTKDRHPTDSIRHFKDATTPHANRVSNNIIFAISKITIFNHPAHPAPESLFLNSVLPFHRLRPFCYYRADVTVFHYRHNTLFPFSASSDANSCYAVMLDYPLSSGQRSRHEKSENHPFLGILFPSRRRVPCDSRVSSRRVLQRTLVCHSHNLFFYDQLPVLQQMAGRQGTDPG